MTPKVPPELYRAALESEHQESKQALARWLVKRSLWEKNPIVTEEERKANLAAIDRQIANLEWAIEDMRGRLDKAGEALEGEAS